jgi:hypothetical protein
MLISGLVVRHNVAGAVFLAKASCWKGHEYRTQSHPMYVASGFRRNKPNWRPTILSATAAPRRGEPNKKSFGGADVHMSGVVFNPVAPYSNPGRMRDSK